MILSFKTSNIIIYFYLFIYLFYIVGVISYDLTDSVTYHHFDVFCLFFYFAEIIYL